MKNAHLMKLFIVSALFLWCNTVWAHDSEETLVQVATRILAPNITPPQLSNSEVRMLENIEAGKRFTPGSPPKDLGNETSWRVEQIIRAEVLYWLCTDPRSTQRITHRGIVLSGVRVDGELDLSNATIPFPLTWLHCFIPSGVTLIQADVKSINFGGTLSGPITADRIWVRGSVHLNSGFRALGMVRLLGATIDGSLDCGDGKFTNSKGYALAGDHIVVKGSVALNDRFESSGSVRFIGAKIGGDLDFSNGQFSKPSDSSVPDVDALTCEGAQIDGNVFLSGKFISLGRVQLVGTQIGGSLSCSGGQITNQDHFTLLSDNMNVGRNVFLSDGFRSQGTASLRGVVVGGDLVLGGGTFEDLGVDGYALGCTNIVVHGSVSLQARQSEIGKPAFKFHSEGRVSFVGAMITSHLIIKDLSDNSSLQLDLRNASAGIYFDDDRTWPNPGNLWIHGFKYGGLHDEAPRSAAKRVQWLDLQPKNQFRPEPYEQLAKVLQAEGNFNDATEILIEKERSRNEFLGKFEWGSWQHIAHSLNGLFLDYGYRPWKPFGFVLALILTGTLVFELGWRWQLIVPTERDAILTASDSTDRSYHLMYPRFNALVYSTNTFAPLVNLYMEDYWLPDANATKRWHSKEWPLGSLLRMYLWFHVISGWALTTILVAGFSGLVKT